MSNHVVLITGGNSGIGFACAELFLSKGYTVLISGRSQEKLDEAKAALNNEKVYTFTADVSKLADISQMYQDIANAGFKIDSLVVNAAVADPLPFELITEEHYDKVMDTNVKGALFTLQKAMPVLNPNPTVVFVTSIARKTATPGFTMYGGSKGALQTMMSILATELIEKGIRVNAVSPGPINTPIYAKMGVEEKDMAAMRESIAQQSPIKRFGEPAEIASAVYFLCSEQSSYMVGEEIVVDGGRSLV